MKPEPTWSPCQQIGEEHNWEVKTYVLQGMSRDWYCSKCGIIVASLGNYG